MFQGDSKEYCCVYGCQETRENNPDCSFFGLPTDNNRLFEWLKLINRPDLLRQPAEKLKSYYVCSSHFEKYHTYDKGMRFLLPNVVPCRNLPEKYVFGSTGLASPSIDYDEIIHTPNLNEERTNSTTDKVTLALPKTQDDFTVNMHKLIEKQMSINNDQNKKDVLYYALNMYLLNPLAYSFVRKALSLPKETTLRNMHIKLSPRLDPRILNLLSSKLKSFPEKAKYCTVCVETLFLNSSLYYDILYDELVGVQNIGGIKNGETAGLAHIVLIRSILVKWDQPIAYCFLPSVKNFAQIEACIDSVISKLFEIGFEVLALVTNQGNNFKNIAFDMKGVSSEKHYFTVDNKKIYCIFEVPQLLKSIRNNLGTKDLYYDDQRISWQFIQQLYELESNKKNKIIPRVTNGHIVLKTFTKNPSVRYAADILSDSVSNAIHAYVDMKKIPEEAKHTAKFCEFMHNLYNLLNSSTYKNDSIYKCALGTHEFQIGFLEKASEFFTGAQWKKFEMKYRKPQATSLPSIQVTIKSIISISKYLAKLGHKLILTERLNLDPLEKIVDIIRHAASKNSEPVKPTPIQFCRLFPRIFMKYIFVKSPLSNRPKAFRKFFEDALNLELNAITAIPADRSLAWLDGDTEYRIELPKQNTTTYVASYIFYKCRRAHSCEKFNKYADALPDLSNTSKSFDGYNKKAAFYGKLKWLDTSFVEYIEQLEYAFLVNFKKDICSNPATQLFCALRNVPFEAPCQCFPKLYVVKLLIRLRMYSTIKAYNKEIIGKFANLSLCEFLSHLSDKYK